MGRPRAEIKLTRENYLVLVKGLLAQITLSDSTPAEPGIWGDLGIKIFEAGKALMQFERTSSDKHFDTMKTKVESAISDLNDKQRNRLQVFVRVNRHLLKTTGKLKDDRQMELIMPTDEPAAAKIWDKALERIAEQDAEDFD